ncbi:MAG: excinuclease ABC subunit UvrC [Alphaproteobacteria bacterium]|nr:excinuclease ABC subunit UvrC [Alphaproteobacteria bacterium]
MQFATLIENVPGLPGVYQMMDADDSLLYVGKAKNLAARLRQYINTDRLPHNIRMMRSRVARIEIITTQTESDALMLESDLIKNKKPKYNILLTDDKMYPMLALSVEEFPRLYKFRGRAIPKKDVFGPYSSVSALHDTIKLIQKVCQLRTCSNSIMKNRARPCLLHQIGRCSAPCKEQPENYNDNVKLARKILSGDTASVITDLSAQMDKASEKLDYEKAAKFRDRIRALSETAMRGKKSGVSADFFAGDFNSSPAIAITRVRNGQYLSNQIIYPKQADGMTPADIMEQTILWFHNHENREPKTESRIPVITNIPTPLLSTVYDSKIMVNESDPEIQKLLNQISTNRKVFGHKEIKWRESVDLLSDWLGIQIERADVFDNSHLSGTSPVGAMIAFDSKGFLKKEYRHYKLKDNTAAGNDIGMMEEFLTRRLATAKQDMPSLLIVDGGKSQWNVAQRVLRNKKLNIPVLGITKGKIRNGDEHFIKPDNTIDTSVQKDSPLFLLLRAVRDEAHRFAVTFHKNIRAKGTTASALEEIESIGAGRRKALLRHFGSVSGISEATRAALLKVPGISKATAEKIYLYFHPESV